MRQGQQNRRNRGRGRNRASNPLSRNYESNGPDVKIKGTAAHIAEKYMALARDQLSSGNTVTAENYFQHAEHYNRIIMAAQAKQEELATQQSGRGPRPNDQQAEAEADDDGEDETAEFSEDGQIPGYGEQPVINGELNAVNEEVEKPKRRPQRPRRPRNASGSANTGSSEQSEGADNDENSAMA